MDQLLEGGLPPELQEMLLQVSLIAAAGGDEAEQHKQYDALEGMLESTTAALGLGSVLGTPPLVDSSIPPEEQAEASGSLSAPPPAETERPPGAATPTFGRSSSLQAAVQRTEASMQAAMRAFNMLAEGQEEGEVGAAEGGHIGLEGFVHAMLHTLHLNLSEEEAGRLFYDMCEKYNAEEEADGQVVARLSRAAFYEAVHSSVFLRRMVKTLSHIDELDTEVARDYDYSRDTMHAHRHPEYRGESPYGTSHSITYSPELHGPLVGSFVDIRRGLDYSYHVNYTEERQLWQDQIVQTSALRHTPVRRPWLVLTCGAMGCGKGYVMRWMSESGVFPLDNVVKVDPDHFKGVMPEWAGYVRHNTEDAGRLCHRESGFIQELCQEVSLRDRQNTWIDGSLQDHAWWATWIAKTRRRFPWYRIAIFYVHCGEEQMLERALKRGQQTGRFIPPERLLQVSRDTAVSVERLGPLVDYVARIDNSCTASAHPELEVFEDRSHSFRAISDRFRQPAPARARPGSFPGSLPASATNQAVDSSLLAGPVQKDLRPGPHAALAEPIVHAGGGRRCDADAGSQLSYSLGHVWEALTARGGDEERSRLRGCVLPTSAALPESRFPEAVREALQGTVLLMSACAPTNMDEHSRQEAGIPREADLFCWCYGAAPGPADQFPGGGIPGRKGSDVPTSSPGDGALGGGLWEAAAAGRGNGQLRGQLEAHADDPLVQLALHGGFVYLSAGDRTLVAMAALCPLESAWDGSRSLILRRYAAGGGAQSVAVEFEHVRRLPGTLDVAHRWVPCTDSFLQTKGCTHIAWLLPKELPTCPMGAFAMQLTGDEAGSTHSVFFPVDAS